MTILSCSVSECDRTRYGRLEVCTMHYKRFRKNGTYEKVRVPQVCSVEDCSRAAYGLTFCQMHYKRYKNHGTTDALPTGRKTCVIEGCSKYRVGHGWCVTHYHRWLRAGDPLYRLAGEVRDGKRICPRCSEDVPLSGYYSATQSYCAECMRQRAREWVKNNPRLAPRLEHKCFTCGEVFVGEKRNWVYCSTECKDAGKNQRNYPHVQKRKMRFSLVPAEQFHRVEIFERDSWVCALCAEPIDKAETFPSRLSASIDHIIPVLLGGTHTRANVQAAHLGCNSSKGARLDDKTEGASWPRGQLSLF